MKRNDGIMYNEPFGCSPVFHKSMILGPAHAGYFGDNVTTVTCLARGKSLVIDDFQTYGATILHTEESAILFVISSVEAF